jgi:hypothetical protein
LLHPFITSNKKEGIYFWNLTTKISTLCSNVKTNNNINRYSRSVNGEIPKAKEPALIGVLPSKRGEGGRGGMIFIVVKAAKGML